MPQALAFDLAAEATRLDQVDSARRDRRNDAAACEENRRLLTSFLTIEFRRPAPLEILAAALPVRQRMTPADARVAREVHAAEALRRAAPTRLADAYVVAGIWATGLSLLAALIFMA